MGEEKTIGSNSKYSEKLIDDICEKISNSSKGLRFILKKFGISSATFYNWIDLHPYVLDKYARARERQADFLADQIISISDNSSKDHTPFTGANVINRDRLRVDARKWKASKLAPKKYGDKIEDSGSKDNPLYVITGMEVI